MEDLQQDHESVHLTPKPSALQTSTPLANIHMKQRDHKLIKLVVAKLAGVKVYADYSPLERNPRATPVVCQVELCELVLK